MGMVRSAKLTEENLPADPDRNLHPVGIESRFEAHLKPLQKPLPLLVGQTRRPPRPRPVPKSGRNLRDFGGGALPTPRWSSD